MPARGGLPSRTGSGRPSLTNQLDNDVYAVVRKFLDDEDESTATPRISTIYQHISKSNTSLSRRPRKVLEDSIQRVLGVIKADQSDSDSASIDDAMMGPEDTGASNISNRSIVGMWAKPSNTPNSKTTTDTKIEDGTGATADAGTKTRKRLANGEPVKKRARTIDTSPPSGISLEDLGGVDSVIDQLIRLLVMPLCRPSSYTSSGIQPPRGILLHGPPGCGKTMIANAIAAELGVPFISLSAPSVVSGMSGESEKALREHFEEAKKLAPCLMFIDEIDAITPKRENAQREMEKRIVAQLLTCMDDLSLEKTGGKPVIVIAATNRPDSLDAALRRGGRFDKEINMSIPTQPVREQILRALTRKMLLAENVDFSKLSQQSPGFVGADLQDLVSTAGSAAMERHLQDLLDKATATDMDVDVTNVSPILLKLRRLLKTAKESDVSTESIRITNEDFFEALPKIQPSLKREGFATVPGTTWADIGALTIIRKQLETAIVDPILNPQKYARVGITAPSGVLLWGPPGCGKTLLARAVANESKANFISIKGPELLNKFVGESERAVRQVFERARASAPCIIFFDELDALAPKRDEGMSDSSARVVNTLLTEMDGLDNRGGIYVVAATNRPDIIDPAMLRPGRLETILYVDLPTKEERVIILKTLLRNMIVFDDTIRQVAEGCDGFSGADLASLARQAGLCAIERDDELRAEDFVKAKETVKPSVGDIKKYRLKRSM